MNQIMNANSNVEVIPEEDIEVINPQYTYYQNTCGFFTSDDFFNQHRTRNLFKLNNDEFHRQNIFGYNNFFTGDDFFNRYERIRNEIHQASMDIDQRIREFDKLYKE